MLTAGAAVLWAAALTPASAHRKASYHGNHSHHRAAKVRYGGRAHRGYWRPGPVAGRGFGFSTYRGDPFGGDDYYDGNRCYYVHHKSFCVANHLFNGFD